MPTDCMPAAKTMDCELRLDNLADLVRMGEGVHRACIRTGFTPESASRAAYRHRRTELIERINAILRGPTDGR